VFWFRSGLALNPPAIHCDKILETPDDCVYPETDRNGKKA
jgi:hypothetical protein